MEDTARLDGGFIAGGNAKGRGRRGRRGVDKDL